MKPDDIERMNAFFDTNRLTPDEAEWQTIDDLAHDPEDGDAAGVAYFTEDGRMLLMRRAQDREHGGEWAFPAGNVEEGETAEMAAAREFHEETGHHLDGEALGDRRSWLDDDTGMRFTAFSAVGPEFKPVLDVEHTDYAWVEPAEMPEPLHPGVIKALKAMSVVS